MKKAKILALILVLSLMATGTAYALWNQNITLTTTATMGEMDVELTCSHDIYPLSFMPGIDNFGPWTYGDMESYMNPLTGTVLAGNDTLEVVVGELYPGAKYGLNYEVRNTGDVPFKLEGVKVNCTDNYPLFAKLSAGFKFFYQHANGTPKLVEVAPSALSSSDFGAAITAACKDIVLYPDDQLIGFFADQDDVTTFMQVLVDDTITGDEFETQHTAFTLKFNWQQCTPVQF